MKIIPCPLCSSSADLPVAEVYDRLMGISGRFTMVRCPSCDLHFLNPQPTREELAPYYPQAYDPYETPLPDQLSWIKRLLVRYGFYKRCKEVLRYKGQGRLLEIGCAKGLFLQAMSQKGLWDLYGVETSEYATTFARRELRLNVFHGSVEEARFPDGYFDVVVMWDVLEHVHDPKKTLQEILRTLKSDGVLIFRLPLLGSWDQKLLGPYWAGWDAPRHLTLFSKLTIERMLIDAGFRVKGMSCISGSYPAFALGVRFWVRERLSSKGQKMVQGVLESWAVRLLVAPFFFFVDRMVKGTVVTVVALPANKTQLPLSRQGN